MRTSSPVLALALAACGDIDVRSVQTGDVVPETLEGEWHGTWTSQQTTSGGDLTVRIQEWKQQAVVSFEIDHPCIGAREYEVSLRGARIELLEDGTPVFSATLREDRTLDGSYGCSSDTGTWRADWAAPLPTAADLSGEWEGFITVAGLPQQPLVLHLNQGVRRGSFVLDGALELPGLLPTSLPVTGAVRFREVGFDVLLTSVSGSNPSVQLTGFGTSDPLAVDIGVFLVAATPPLPFSQGVWSVEWRGR